MSEKMYELTNPQKSIWLTEQYYNGTSINNICGSLLVKHELNTELFNLAINKFIENNDSFRLKFKLVDGNCFQYLSENKFINFEVINLKDEKEVSKTSNDIVSIPFNFYESRLFDFKIFKLDNGFGGFIINVHHIISDAATLSFVGTQIMEIYSNLLKNEDFEITSFSYIDYVSSEKEYLQSNRFQKDKEYWNDLLTPIPDVATIPSFKNEQDTPKSNRIEFSFNKKLLNQINNFCKENTISMYNFLMAIYSIYIGRVNNMECFTLGTPILNRTTFFEKHTSGMFISTSLLKVNTEQNLNFNNFAQLIAQNCMQMLRHQKYNYQYIIEDARKLDNSVANLYDILLSYQITKATDSSLDIPYESTWYGTPYIGNSLDIHFHDNSDSGNLLVEYDYKICKYDKKDIKDMHNRIMHIVSQVLENNSIGIHDIEIVTEDEKNKILYNFNDTKADYNYSKNIILEIEKIAKVFPNRIAIQTPNNSISYSDLIHRINQLSNHLINQYNILESSNVGISTNRTIDTIIGILAILKINCTYVPIDPTYPISRINHMIETSQIKFVLTDNMDIDKTIFTNLQLINISYFNYCNENTLFDKNLHYDINSNLYIIFTSGSTGKPKGVTLTHSNMMNLIFYEKNRTNIFEKENKILQFATMSFDVSYQEIYSSFLTGSTLVLINDSIRKDMDKLSNYIIQNDINILFIPPAYLRLLTEDINIITRLSHIKSIITAGEQLIITEGIKQLINLGVNIYNHYGPAETHVASTYQITNANIINPPIGFPISNTQILILDKYNSIMPINTIGQISISGNCVGNGYFNNSVLTEEKFTINKYFNCKNYSTGDLGYIDEKGCIYYVGRSDFQVKINGFRIELGEIENAILKLSYIKSVYVTSIKYSENKNKLLAFVTLNDTFNDYNIKRDLKKFIPQYMIPHLFYQVTNLPINTNGKIDKKKLLEQIDNYKLLSQSTSYVSKSSLLEQKLLFLFKKILNNESLNINDDFFEYGGDSLSAISLQSESSKIGILFNTQEIYDYPTVALLANHLQMKEKHTSQYSIANILKPHEKTVQILSQNNILITGCTGFLGIHVLNVLLNTKNKLYCIVRHTQNKTSEERLIDLYKYYFNCDISNIINSQIFIIDGDLTSDKFGLDENYYNLLSQKIDLIINCAASVKHYTSRKYNYDSNVISTQNIIDFSINGNCLLNHISTIGICGNDLVDTNNCFKFTFSEDDFFINQDYKSNVYVETKFEAEQLILKNISENKLSANILRVGNLMNRYSDNKFQINPYNNAFQNKIRAIADIGIFTKQLTKFTFDLTPVDLCALAIVKLSLNNSYNNIYHVLNSKQFSFDDLKYAFELNNINLKIDSTDNIETIFNNLPAEKNESYKWILNDLLLNNTHRIIIESEKTENILRKLDFNWNIIDNNYYKNVFNYILKGDGKNN